MHLWNEKGSEKIIFLCCLCTVQLDSETEVVGNDHDEKSSNFLDCDWANIGDFDDFDRLFR
jgi:hypothetical protein